LFAFVLKKDNRYVHLLSIFLTIDGQRFHQYQKTEESPLAISHYRILRTYT